MTKRSPSELGYSMPAEWARHEATWLSWPKNPLTFPPEILPNVERAYFEMVDALANGERVDILVDDAATERRLGSTFSSKNVVFHRIKSADVWMRDYGPIFVKDGKRVAATKWKFNAWGWKYDDLLPDDAAGMKVAKSTGLEVFEGGIFLEGGSIDANGKGALLTTKQCLLNKNRNPELGRTQIEKKLQKFLGVEDVIWLGRGIEGDDTDGHVDDIARFVAEDTVVCMTEKNPRDKNHAVLKKNLETLREYRTPKGRRLRIVPIQMPTRIKGDDGWLPASYANFYIGNSAVLLPVFGDVENDRKAIKTMEGLFPGRSIVPVRSNELVYGFGGIHCVTQQQPA